MHSGGDSLSALFCLKPHRNHSATDYLHFYRTLQIIFIQYVQKSVEKQTQNVQNLNLFTVSSYFRQKISIRNLHIAQIGNSFL